MVIGQIIGLIDEALFGEWRAILYDAPNSKLKGHRIFGLALFCDYPFAQRIGVLDRLTEINCKIKGSWRSKSPEGWILFKIKLGTRKQMQRLAEALNRVYPDNIEQDVGFWKMVEKMDKDVANHFLSRTEVRNANEVIVWDNVIT